MEAVVEKKCPSCRSMHVENTKCCVSCIVKAKARYDLKKEEILQKSKEDRIKNPDKYKQINKKKYENHKQEIQQKNKEYYQEHKEEISQQRKEHYKEHKEEISQQRQEYYNEHKEKINERRREKRANEPEVALAKSQTYSNSSIGKCRDIVSGAKQRQIDVDMTRDDIMKLTDMPCFYCGTETTDKVSRNGIDRMNNLIGYTLNNSVSCCWMCNNMKKCLDALTFVERCAHISYEHGGSGQVTDKWFDVIGKSYARYKSRINREAKHVFELTYEQYITLRKQSCFYCHRVSTTDKHLNGIDRKDSNIGYILENCVSCCGGCNLAKGTNLPNVFIEQCKKIAVYKHDIPKMPRQLCIMG
ncbi:hypothetical protein PBCVOR070422_071R [Paramecium bursaria Chlorella virus OR0704.2.2]|nr:hypothetical protein PBCVOR070422_071R [Paramecium bursaria Chlorella virus OR0704.2.2]